MDIFDMVESLAKITKKFGNANHLAYTHCRTHRPKGDTVLSVISEGNGDSRVRLTDPAFTEMDDEFYAACRVDGADLTGHTYPSESGYSFSRFDGREDKK